MTADFHFLRPWWFIALVPLALLLVALWRSSSGASVWRNLVDQHLLPHLLVGEEGRPRRRPLFLLGLGWLLAVTALAGPVWQRLPQPVFSTTAERVILLDLSPSMNAADLSPSRLTRARYEILDLLRESKEGQTALIAFGPEPFLVSPLTGDAQTIAAQVPQLTTDLIPAPGPQRTDLAIKMAGDLLDQAQAQGGDIVLVTDGVADPAAALDAAKALAAHGRRLSVLAVGTAKGAPVPAAQGGFIKDASGGIAISKLDPAPLRALARAGRGRFIEAEAGDSDTRALLDEGPKLDQQVKKTTLLADQWKEEGPWLLLALLPLAALAFRRGWLLSLFAVTLFLPPDPSQAGVWSDLWQRPDQQAASRLEAGDSKGAASQFQDPAWRAAAHYRAGDYDRAMQSLKGLSGEEADYNRGNALVRLGELEKAAESYERVLKQSPDNEDAKHNLELVRRLQEQQQKQKDQSKDSKGDKGSDNGKESQAGGKSSQGDQQEESTSGERGGDSKQNESKDEKGAQSAQQSENAGEKPNQQAGEDKDSKSGSGQSGEPKQSPGASSETEQQPKGEKQPGQEKGTEQGESAKPSAGQSGDSSGAKQAQGRQPNASDLMPNAASGQAQQSEEKKGADQQAGAGGSKEAQDAEKMSSASASSSLASMSPEEREEQQAMRAQLERVPDDPGGLLRQRFLLQHLRREGRLP